MRKIAVIILGVAATLYIGLYVYFYSIQYDRFRSTKLADEHEFRFKQEFEELNFPTTDGGRINSLLFKADSSRGAICFWKGNGGNLDKWGEIAPLFLNCNYDLLITDYREHGKSKGDITIENFYSDSQLVYDFLKTRYPEHEIAVVGYSLGANIASHLSAGNKPFMTILIDPRTNFQNKYLDVFFFPFPNINRFPFRTDLDIQQTKAPVAMVTGTKSDLYNDAIGLKKNLKEKDKLFEIEGADHRTILQDNELIKIFRLLLSERDK